MRKFNWLLIPAVTMIVACDGNPIEGEPSYVETYAESYIGVGVGASWHRRQFAPLNSGVRLTIFRGPDESIAVSRHDFSPRPETEVVCTYVSSYVPRLGTFFVDRLAAGSHPACAVPGDEFSPERSQILVGAPLDWLGLSPAVIQEHYAANFGAPPESAGPEELLVLNQAREWQQEGREVRGGWFIQPELLGGGTPAPDEFPHECRTRPEPPSVCQPGISSSSSWLALAEIGGGAAAEAEAEAEEAMRAGEPVRPEGEAYGIGLLRERLIAAGLDPTDFGGAVID